MKDKQPMELNVAQIVSVPDVCAPSVSVFPAECGAL